MQRLLSLLGVAAISVLLFVPLQASALDRIVATFTNGDAYLKEGPTYATWEQMTAGVTIGNLSLAGDWISLVNAGDSPNNEVSVKQPNWDSPWEWTTWGTPTNTKALVSKLSNGEYRQLVLRNDGSVTIKDGTWNSGWWSGTVESSGVTDIVIGGDNIGVIMSDGTFKAKQLTPGKFSHPNNTPWSNLASNVSEAVMSNDWIAVKDSSNNVYAKAGNVNAPWYGNHAVIYDNASKVRVSSQRLCVVKVDTSVECKQGALGASSKLTYSSATDVKVSSTRFVVTTSAHNAYVLEGNLYGANSGWNFIGIGNIASVEIN